VDTFATRPTSTDLTSGWSDPIESPPDRIDVVRAVAGLRHIDPSAEPAMVFSHLAAVCVPAVCDDMVIDVVENGQAYRIRRPAADRQDSSRPSPALAGSVASRGAILGPDSVTLTIPPAPESAGAPFHGRVECRWRDGYIPTQSDASLIELMVDHAAALVVRERLGLGHQPDGRGETLDGSLQRDRRMASAVEVVMAMHHVDRSRAMGLLLRLSDRAYRDVQEIAETVVTTGRVPDLADDIPAQTPAAGDGFRSMNPPTGGGGGGQAAAQ
jgi:hypothetical protein